MANLITIEQLLESVDLDFEPRWVTKDEDGIVKVWGKKPRELNRGWCGDRLTAPAAYDYLKLSEFDGKDCTECIYEVPRKTTGKIEKLGKLNVSSTNMTMNQNTVDKVVNILNQVIEAVNELKGEKNENNI